MSEQTSTVGSRLRRARQARGLSLDDVVARLEQCVTKAALSKYELGKSTPERAEDSGVLILGSSEIARFDPISGRTASGFPVVVLDPARPSAKLRRDLAHELGHLLFARAGSGPKDEALAERFAAAFLVPGEAARHELGRRRAHVTREELEQLEAA